MPDDLDNQLRAAMKTLDEQSPSGYFDALPNQILARLEDGSMQHGSTTSVRDKQRDALTGPPVVAAPKPAAAAAMAAAAAKPAAAAAAATAAAATADSTDKTERTEDSGLHDIRNLAQSTKQRLSKARDAQHAPMSDDDALASSSGSWKNVALPQPARMVALPELEALPSKAELAAAEKAAEKRLAEATKKAKKADKGAPSDEVLAPVASANAALDAMSAKPAAFETRQAFTLPSQQNKRSKGPILAVLGLGMAAAAGGVIFMQMSKDEKSETAAATAAAPAVEAQKAPEPTPAPAAAPEVAAAGSAAPTVEPIVEEQVADEPEAVAAADTKADAKESKVSKRAGKGGKKSVEKEPDESKPEVKVEEKKPEPKTEPVKKPGKGEEGEPSFDALLKEAGVDEKKEVKPKLEKKSLSGDDFKQGMSGIAGKAQGCYKGTQGTAMVKLTVAPTGKVSKVTVAGQFAGAPEGKCVESAVKSASFPPWDGGPQSFSYSYMLAD